MTPQPPSESILKLARAEGYAEGVKFGRDSARQTLFAACDEADHEGYLRGLREGARGRPSWALTFLLMASVAGAVALF